MPEHTGAVISHTSPIQYLYQVGLLDLLPTLYGRVYIPEAVAQVTAEGRARSVSLPDLSECDWLQIRPVRERKILAMVASLGSGEHEALALALQSPGSLLILDDLQARRYAQILGMAFTGTLGVLLRAKREGKLKAVGPVLDLLDSLRFRVAPKTRERVIRPAGESL